MHHTSTELSQIDNASPIIINCAVLQIYRLFKLAQLLKHTLSSVYEYLYRSILIFMSITANLVQADKMLSRY